MKKIKLQLTDEVIQAINTELEYQYEMSNSSRTDEADHGVEGQLVTLESYTRKAFDAWVSESTNEGALDNLRKIAAIAARALILYGCPKRKLKTEEKKEK